MESSHPSRSAGGELSAFAPPSGISDEILSSITDFLFLLDREGRFHYANKPLLDLWGITLEQAVGKNFTDLSYPPDLATKLSKQVRDVYETRQRISDETPYVSPAGVSGYYEYVFSPVMAADGSVQIIAGSARDVTSRRLAENLVQAQKQSLEQVASGKPLIEILSYLTRIVEEQSGGRAIAAILLLDDEGCLRIGAAPSLPDDYNGAIDGIEARADLGTCSVAAVTGKVVVTPDIASEPKWECIKHLPLNLGLKAAWSRPIVARNGKILGTFGTYFRECREPTAIEQQVVEILARTAAVAIERARSDEERERLLASERSLRAEADAANRAKDKFLAVLSHELRTPLNPVTMLIPVLEADPNLPEKFREDLAMIRRNIELEVKLIDDLLDVSRVISGKLVLQLQPVNVHEVLEHAICNSAADAVAKRIVIRQKLDASNDCITADPARLQQVFWNLIRNAVKFTPDGGQINIRTRNLQGSGGALQIEVEDNGIGMRPEVLSRVFDAFEQGDAQMNRRFGGLGLGLAIAKGVVEMHGGAITAASAGVGLGSTFSLQFSTIAQSVTSQPATPDRDAAKSRDSNRTRVLFVEDHADTARALTHLLRASGYHVRTADSAAAALQLAASESFDIVLSDIGLPDTTGYALMQELRDRHQIKGIALSGYGMDSDIVRSRDAGFVEHMIKPINVEQLRIVIDRVTSATSSVPAEI